MSPRLFECSECGGFNGYRSRPRNFTEKFIMPLLFVRPVRCGNCYQRTFQSMLVAVLPRRESKKIQSVTA